MRDASSDAGTFALSTDGLPRSPPAITRSDADDRGPSVATPRRNRREGGKGESDVPRLRPAAKALIRSSDRVLLVAERHADGTPYWTLPGGGVHDDETVPEALRRELREELACRTVVDDHVTTFWYRHTSLEDTVSVYRVRECAVLSEPNPVRTDGVVGICWAPSTDPPVRTLPQVRGVLRDCERRGSRD